jgi:hypothetical protein
MENKVPPNIENLRAFLPAKKDTETYVLLENNLPSQK